MKVCISLRLLVIFVLVSLLFSSKTAPAAVFAAPAAVFAAEAAAYTVPCRVSDLIAAIQQANASPADDVINLQAGCTYVLTAVNNTQDGAKGLPVIASETTAGKLTINGNGATIVREYRIFLPISMRAGAQNAPAKSETVTEAQASSTADIPDFRLILVASGGHLTLNTVILKGGRLADEDGGAIFNAGTLVISDSTITGSSAVEGGAIFNVGDLTIINNVISGNTASGPGGGISSSGVLHVTATLFTGNTAIVGDGIFLSSGESYVINVTFTGDSAYTCPASPRTIPAGDTPGLIDAIYCANSRPGDDVINLTNSTYTLATANNDGYGLGSTGLPVIGDQAAAGSLTINGNGATLARSGANGTPAFRLFLLDGGSLTLNDLSLQHGYLNGSAGGAISVETGTLNLNHAQVADSSAGYGGGLANGGGVVTITNSTFSGNTSTNDGAAINSGGALTVTGSLITGNYAHGLGGGIITPGGPAIITNTTFSNNRADGMASGAALMIFALQGHPLTVATVSGCAFFNNHGNGTGGALFTTLGTQTTVTNSTFAGNSAAAGGAVANNGTLTIQHSTIIGNTAEHEGGGIDFGQGILNLSHTIVARNTAGTGPDIHGTVVSQGYNIIGSTQDATITGTAAGNLVDSAAEPLNLSPLGEHGGPTQTIALVKGSIAIDAGDASIPAPPAFDQRGAGYPRIQNGRIDIGAFEFDGAFTCPASPYTVPAADTSTLVAAIDCANASPADDVINMTNSTYTLTTVNNNGQGTGDVGLPVISSTVSAGKLTINGNRATISRSSDAGTPNFRLFLVNDGADLTINDLILQNARLTGQNGGAIVNLGSLAIHNSTFSGNQTGAAGGVIYSTGPALTVQDSSFTANAAAYGGVIAFNAGSVTVTNSTFSANTTVNDGAVINGSGTLVVTNSLFSGNSATGLSGGILINDGTAAITDSTFRNNTTNAMAGGGGLLVGAATVNVSGCTFSGNGGPNAGAGGGIFNGGGNVTVTNSTFTGNTAYNGGAIWNGGSMTVKHTTISGNDARGDGGGIYRANDTAVTSFSETILALNTASHASPDIYGAINSLGYNVIGSSVGGTINGITTGNRIDAAAAPLALGPLQDNGGPTQTMALGPTSVALNAGDPAFAAPPAYDQRGSGHPRVKNGRIDIGAYESAAPANCPLVNEVTIPAGNVNALIDAIDCANASPADNIINLTNSTYTLSLVDNDGYGQGSTGLPVINSSAAAGKLTLNGSNATLQRSSATGTPEFRILMLSSGSNVTINNLNMQNGRLTGQNGGAIYANQGTLALVFSNVEGNTAAYGGGLAFDNAVVTVRGGMFNTNTSLNDGAAMNGSGTLSVTEGNISWNTAYGLGGGILIGQGTATISQTTIMHNTANALAGGGGLLVINASVSVSDSTFWDNGGPNAGAGGALFNGGGTVSVVNSTFTGNQAHDGGAIWNNGTLTLTHSTLAGNMARHNGGGLFQASDTAVLHLGHTIVAGNSAASSGPDISGTIDSLGYNLIGDTGGAAVQGSQTGNLTGSAAAPLNLGPLQNNGGPTDTMALQAGSVAINAGDPSFAAPPGNDQRGAGHPRVQGGRIDIGAYESVP